MNNKLMRFLVYQQGTNGHGGLQLESLPIVLLHLQGDGIILNLCLSFLTERCTLGDSIYEFAGNGNLTFGFLGQ